MKRIKTEQPKDKDGNAFGVAYLTGAMGNMCDSCTGQQDCFYSRKPADLQHVVQCRQYRRRGSYL